MSSLVAGLVEYKDSFTWVRGETFFTEPTTVAVALAVYILGCLHLQSWMRNREAFNVTSLVVVHNAGLCIASLAMCIGTIYEVSRVVLAKYPDHVLGEAWCDTKSEIMAPSSGFPFWSYMYYLSKFWEMLDTVILALKKKPLTFLQMYHHSIIIVLCYVWLDSAWPLHWWVVLANTLVHVFMYYYFSLAALGRSVWWKKV